MNGQPSFSGEFLILFPFIKGLEHTHRGRFTHSYHCCPRLSQRLLHLLQLGLLLPDHLPQLLQHVGVLLAALLQVLAGLVLLPLHLLLPLAALLQVLLKLALLALPQGGWEMPSLTLIIPGYLESSVVQRGLLQTPTPPQIATIYRPIATKFSLCVAQR